MAKCRVPRGFGLMDREHIDSAEHAIDLAREQVQRAALLMDNGECLAAWKGLTEAYTTIGRSQAHMLSKAGSLGDRYKAKHRANKEKADFVRSVIFETCGCSKLTEPWK